MITGKKTTEYGALVGQELFYIMTECYTYKKYLQEYIELVEERIEHKRQNFRNELEMYLRKTAEEEKALVYESYQENIVKYEKFSPKLLYESVYLSIYTYLEQALGEICCCLYHDFDHVLIPRYTSNIISNYYAVIKNFGNFSLLNADWDKIISRTDSFQRKRNGIVHNHFPRTPITRDIVADFNLTVQKLICGIYKNIEIPEALPDVRFIPIAKRNKKRKVRV